MMKTATTNKIYDANFPSRESVREIHSRGQTSARFSIGWHLSIIETLFPPLFRYRRPSPSLAPPEPFRCLSRPPPTARFSLLLLLLPFPPRRVSFPKHIPRKCSKQIKRLLDARRISMLFLSYQRATNERAVRPSSVPLFSRTILLYPRYAGIARIHVAGNVISDRRVMSITE